MSFECLRIRTPATVTGLVPVAGVTSDAGLSVVAMMQITTRVERQVGIANGRAGATVG